MDGESASFGEVLRRLRAAAGLSQDDLAERAGLSVRGISDLERGARRAPHLHTVRLISDALSASESDRGLLLLAARPPPHEVGDIPGATRHWVRLPHPLTRLVGRERQLDALRALLGRDDVRLVTLIGAGGIGKTRLAFALAAELAGGLADGVVFVDLAPLRDSDGVPAAIAAALDIRETGTSPLANAVRDALVPRQLLLLIDNFEHLLPAAPVITEILQAAPRVKALITSRQPLRLRGEREFVVPPLELPEPLSLTRAETSNRSEAVTLFVERAQDVRFDYALTDVDAPAIEEIVIRLDGLPLAIELAAAWSRALPLPALASRLERRLPLLSVGARDAPSRHQTMRAAIAWSYDLLSPDEQQLFRRLAVFAGGFTLDAAEALDEPGSSIGTLARLTRLVDQHFVRVQFMEEEHLRYAMLATIREFAREQLAASGEEPDACERHAAVYLDLAERASPNLHGPRQQVWLIRLGPEHDNLRAAIDWTIEHGDAQRAVQFGAHLWLYWLLQVYWTEGRIWLQRVLALAGEAPTAQRGEVLFGAGNLAGILGDLDEAERLFDASLMDWREINSASGIARSLSAKGVAALYRMQFEKAVALQREALPLFDLPKDEPWAALAASALGIALVGCGDLDGGLAQSEEALARQNAFGEHWATSSALVMLGDVLVSKGEHRRAAAFFADGLKNWTDSGATGFMIWPLAGLAKIASMTGRAVDAARLIGLHDAVVDQTSAAVNPYYRQFIVQAATIAVGRLGASIFDAERAVARETPPDRIALDALRIAGSLAAEA